MISRWVVRRDLPEIEAIEHATGGTWTQAEFLNCLRRRECIGITVEHREVVAGYVFYELMPNAVKLLKFAISPAYQRRRFGSALMAKMVYKLISHRRGAMVAAVPEEWLPAHLFLKASGWKAVGVSDGAIRFVYLPSDSDFREYDYPPPVRTVTAY